MYESGCATGMYEGLEDTFRVFADILTLREGACARAAGWFELLPILYSYKAILEVIF